MEQLLNKRLIHGIVLIFLGTFFVGLCLVLNVIFLPDTANPTTDISGYIGGISFAIGVSGGIISLIGCILFIPSTLRKGKETVHFPAKAHKV